MNEVQIFNSPEFGSVRTLEENGAVLFCGTDVARALGYRNPRDAISKHCKGVVKRDGVSQTTNQHGTTTEQKNEMSFIPESDLYRLVFGSKLPTAERFTDWVTSEVLPTIRKHGAYMTREALDAAIRDPDYLLRIVTALKEETDKRRALEQKAAEDSPKVLFADAVSTSDSAILIGELAKLIRQNGVEIGQNRLFQWMRDSGYLCAAGERYNMPTQRAMELGLFRVKETAISQPDGSVRVTRTTKVTGKGQQFFINKFLTARGTA